MATEFVKGVILYNKEGAVYDDIVYDRWIGLQCANGHLLSIFDMMPPIGTDLIVGNIYQLVIAAAIVNEVKIFKDEMPPTDPKLKLWGGKIVEFPWKATNSSFKNSQEGFFEGEWLLLATEIGQVLVDFDAVSAEERTGLQVGGYLQVVRPRWDLYAIV